MDDSTNVTSSNKRQGNDCKEEKIMDLSESHLKKINQNIIKTRFCILT